MSDEQSRRAGADESMFRRVNEAIERGRWPGEEDRIATFRCECAERSCSRMLEITPAEYERVRAHPRRFVLAPGHELPDVEAVVERRAGYVVVEKNDAAGRVAEAENPRT